MGIDARMFVRTKAKITEEQVREWAYRLGEAFGPESFWIFKDRGEGIPPRHCLSLIKEHHQDGPTIKPKSGETFIAVHPATRYYGVGYERGNIVLLIGIAEWLEANIPDCEVWYGGDSSGVEAEKFDRKARADVMRHFADGGHTAYRDVFDNDHGDGIKAPLCKFCWKVMRRYGWGKDYAAFHCAGCGEDIMTRNSGKTFQPKNDDWEMTVGGPSFECPSCKTELVTRDAGKSFVPLKDAKKMAEAEKKRKEERKNDRRKA